MKVQQILVSQPAPLSLERSPFAQMIEKFSVKVDFVPLIRVEGVSLREFRSQRVEILDHTAILLTSRKTVDHFFRIVGEARINVPETMKYLCNSEQVALYLQKYIVYRKRKIFFADGSFAGFMELILKHRDERMLLTLSEPNNGELQEALGKLKVEVGKVVLSRAVPCDLSGLKIARYDMMVVYSPAEVAALTAAFGPERLPMVASFGNGTARAVVEAGIPLRVMAPTPQAPSMTRAIELFLESQALGKELVPVVLDGESRVEQFVRAQQAKPTRRVRKK